MEMALELAPRRYARRARRGRMTAIGGFNTGIRKGVRQVDPLSAGPVEDSVVVARRWCAGGECGRENDRSDTAHGTRVE